MVTFGGFKYWMNLEIASWERVEEFESSPSTCNLIEDANFELTFANMVGLETTYSTTWEGVKELIFQKLDWPLMLGFRG